MGVSCGNVCFSQQTHGRRKEDGNEERGGANGKWSTNRDEEDPENEESGFTTEFIGCEL